MSTPYTPGHIHRIPYYDVIAHERTEDCLCGPTVAHQPNDNGPDRWTYTHHRLGTDGQTWNE